MLHTTTHRFAVPTFATALILQAVMGQTDAPGAVQLQSRAAAAFTSNSPSGNVEISGNGRFVAFASRANNLVPGDTNGRTDIFVRDRLTGSIERVNVSNSGVQANDHCYYPSISDDGNRVAFYGFATNIVPGNATLDTVFVRDRAAGTTFRINGIGGFPANNKCVTPRISGDGNYVTFETTATNFVAGDTPNTDCMLVEIDTGAIFAASHAANGSVGNGFSFSPAVSRDGRYVCFHGTSSNLVAGDTNGARDVFRFDRITGQTIRCSVSSAGVQGNGRSWRSSINADGRYVAFNSAANVLVPNDTNGTFDIFVHDTTTGSTERVSVASNGGEATGFNSSQCFPNVSEDGRYVTFLSDLSGMVAGTGPGFHFYRHDRTTNTTLLVDTDAAGVGGSQGVQAAYSDGVFSHNERATQSADGQVVAFTSRSINLFGGNTLLDRVYAKDLGIAATSPGPAMVGGSAVTDLAAASYAGAFYVGAFALGYQGGVMLPGDWRLPLDDDFLLGASAAGGGAFQNNLGSIDANGDAQWSVLVPAIPSLSGLVFYSAAVVFDFAPGLTVRGVSNAVPFTIQ
ncbi:MAG: TolB family protein [Planctomycetota bacterium]